MVAGKQIFNFEAILVAYKFWEKSSVVSEALRKKETWY